jgi:uncharacterized protein (DUF2252 family)
MMPCTIDLARLATSATLATRQSSLAIDADDACTAILEGYRAGIGGDAGAFALEKDHAWLRDPAIGGLRNPVKFWAKTQAHGRGSDRRLEGMEAISPAGYESNTRVPVFASM